MGGGRPTTAAATIDPQAWADAVFRDPPGWVGVLLGVRNALVGRVGIERRDASAFATLDRTEDEVLLGTDDTHLDFRGSVLVEERAVTLSTLVRILLGWIYMAVVCRCTRSWSAPCCVVLGT